MCPRTKIIGVESEKCPSFSKALERGEPIGVKIEPTLADGYLIVKFYYRQQISSIYF